jgi:hypothetical protein
MRRCDDFFKENSDDDIKKRLNVWIEEQELTDEESIKLLQSVLDQRRNIRLVTENAQKAGLSLEKFISNSDLELYFDILKKDKSVGYISKGWSDPGFRVGEYFEMAKDDSAFKEKFFKVFQACSTSLISVSVSEKMPGVVGISLDIGIYKDGFNEKVLKDAVETLEETMGRIKSILDEA